MAPGTQERGPPTVDALDSGLGLSGPKQPPAWENPGLLPGAAALPGRAGEGIPGICPETAVASLGRIGPYMGSASAASAGKAPARASGRGCACALHVSPQASCPQVLGGWARSAPWTFQPPGSGYARRVGHPGWDCEMPGQSWRRDTNTGASPNSSGVWAAQHSPPSARPASKKETTEINKESFFFYLNRFNKKSERTHTHKHILK